MNSEIRTKVYKDTQNISLRYFKNVPRSIKYNKKSLIGIIPKKDTVPKITVIQKDTLDTVVNLIIKGLEPVVLNVACGEGPGGEVEHGCSAQEENLFRRTNYFLTLTPTANFYPLVGSETIYSKDVTLFKSNEETSYSLIDPIYISLIACSSVKLPELDNYKKFKCHNDLKMQYDKICMILKTAIINDHDSIVLSAFGCGTYACPPDQVAKLFKIAIEEYGSYFKEIVFAIKQPVGDNAINNYEIFKTIITSS